MLRLLFGWLLLLFYDNTALWNWASFSRSATISTWNQHTTRRRLGDLPRAVFAPFSYNRLWSSLCWAELSSTFYACSTPSRAEFGLFLVVLTRIYLFAHTILRDCFEPRGQRPALQHHACGPPDRACFFFDGWIIGSTYSGSIATLDTPLMQLGVSAEETWIRRG